MKMKQYPMSTGQIVVSPVDLSYAYNNSLIIDKNLISDTDWKKISVLADPDMADIITELADGKQWRAPAEVLSNPNDPSVSPVKHKCLIQNGTIYIKDGRKYLKLEDLIQTATMEELEILLCSVAYQAAVCQAALAGLEISGIKQQSSELEQAI